MVSFAVEPKGNSVMHMMPYNGILYCHLLKSCCNMLGSYHMLESCIAKLMESSTFLPLVRKSVLSLAGILFCRMLELCTVTCWILALSHAGILYCHMLESCIITC